MGNLLMTPDQIRMGIRLTDKTWKNDVNTNCYAFALGLDISEWDIAPNAYQPGMMFSIMFNKPYDEVKKMSFEERLLLDLKVLKIKCKEADPSEFTGYNAENDTIQWVISMFESEEREDVHFLRKNDKGIWWHKHGYIFSSPTNKDHYRKIITDPRDCFLGSYEYKKTYKLSINRDTKKY